MFCTLLLGGCRSALIDLMVRAPNHGKQIDPERIPPQSWLKFWGIDQELRLPVGPPDALLRVWIIDPPEDSPHAAAPKGTILVLHGYRASSMWLRGMGKNFAEHGYRIIMIDSRGHGQSTGDYITFGVRESQDLIQIIDQLQARDLILGRLGTWGISMGGATAIQHAAIDPRVQTVVAVAPYRSFRDAVPHLVRRFVPGYGWMLKDSQIQHIVDEAGKRAHFDPNACDTANAIAKLQIPILLVHGKSDFVIPDDHSQQLHEAAPEHSKLLTLGLQGHISTHFSGKVEDYSVHWFDEYLAELGHNEDQLRSETGGQGSFSMEFSHYEPVPPNVQQQLVSAFKPKAEED